MANRRMKQTEYQKQWAASRKALFFEGMVCLDCGRGENLELHHRDPGEKEDHRIWSWSTERILAEVSKCDIVCRDCHMDRHWGVPDSLGFRSHGASAYRKGCRCGTCRKAHRQRMRRYRE